MKIERIRLFQVALPLVRGFETSSHRKNGLVHILVEATDAAGRIGWGEIASPADPYYGSETTSSAWDTAVRYLAPAVQGIEWDDPATLEKSWARIRGHRFAKAGFSIAAWDLFARDAGLPLATALGATRDVVDAGVSLGIEPDVASLLAQVEHHVASGYRRVKLKIAPGWDILPVHAVRARFPELDLHVDANGAYPDTAQSAAALRALDAEQLTMIEQPYAPRDFLAHARLQATIATPICLDESVEDLADLHTMLALDAGRVLNIKISRMGGLTVARAAHDVAREAGIPVWCGGMHEFGVGRAAGVALSALPGFTLPSDVSGSDKYYARDVIVPPVIARDGRVQVPTSPGLGHDVDLDWILENTERRFDTAALVEHR